MHLRTRLSLFCVLLALPGLAASGVPEVAVKLLNAPAAPVAPVVEQMRAAGVTAVFCRTDKLFSDAAAGRNLREFRKLLAAAGIQFYITAPVFCDPDAVRKNPELLGVGHLGNPSKTPNVEWNSFVCPVRPAYRKQRMANIVDHVRELHPDGLSLDFIRYFVYWEGVKPDQSGDSIEKFCFCDSCLRLMNSELGFRFPANAVTREQKAAWVLGTHREEWTAWKCEKITSMVRDTVAAARTVVPGLRISLHGVPWMERDYDGGRRVIAGQDLQKLAPFVDSFGPMAYFQMLHRPPEWVHDVAADYFRATGKAPLPSVQASGSNRNETIAADLFRRHVQAGLESPSAGINVFNWERLSRDPEKLDVLHQALAAPGRSNVKFAGARSSGYGIRPFPPPENWGNALKTMAGYFPGSTPVGIWIVGRLNGRSTGMMLEFPHPPGDKDYGPLYTFAEEDKHEPFLKYFDDHGIKVFLQVEPGFADVNTAIDLVLERYQQHPSVIRIRHRRGVVPECANGRPQRLRHRRTGERLGGARQIASPRLPALRQAFLHQQSPSHVPR